MMVHFNYQLANILELKSQLIDFGLLENVFFGSFVEQAVCQIEGGC